LRKICRRTPRWREPWGATPGSNASDRFFRHGRTKKNIFRCSPPGKKLAAYWLSRAAGGFRRAEFAHAPQCFPRTALVYPERAKDVDHERRIADVNIVFAKVDGEKFSCFIVERAFPGFFTGAEKKKMGLKQARRRLSFRKLPGAQGNLLHELARAHRRVQHLNAGRFSLGAYCTGGAKRSLETARNTRRSARPSASPSVIRTDPREAGRNGDSHFCVESMISVRGLMDRAISAAGDGADKSQQSMKVFEEYAIESSISKVLWIGAAGFRRR